MTIWSNTAVLGLYTLSPTHYGTGQTTGAVDLPIARDAATGFPVLPAPGIKGVLRDVAEHTDALAGKVTALFGAWIGGTESGDLAPGLLAFTEARLIAYPARSLSRPFLHVTFPLILEGLMRDLRATGGSLGSPLDTITVSEESGARVADPALDGEAVILEDLIYPAEEVTHDKAVEALANSLAALIPDHETATRARLTRGLVVIPDADFAALMQSAIPVHARVQLTSMKTTDSHNGESGNLWYEEALPSDCLFAALIGERRARPGGRANAHTGNDRAGLGDLISRADAFGVLQIGGNETVGQGLCLGTLLAGQTGRAAP
ncbi:type III-B CRISPR module RAMP protein Cmr4 [Roseospira navarrensis]|uniref:Type III-B CRISPR module RAMP protein Cmr4 n=1 Tax=Roseospira navarrensis TaxID=140058 RepID=A0A7X2D5D2_9PROT|nr:type III-B CRISPR module RAMP protein Cmr4 [Roseospira navarrensis]MQX37567.1 type III-B CRISPR module RAMP protein Cmr4 [Roseospira navarrensis]